MSNLPQQVIEESLSGLLGERDTLSVNFSLKTKQQWKTI